MDAVRAKLIVKHALKWGVMIPLATQIVARTVLSVQTYANGVAWELIAQLQLVHVLLEEQADAVIFATYLKVYLLQTCVVVLVVILDAHQLVARQR